MKIGLMTTPTRPVPPKEQSIHAPKYMIADLANGLVDKGHTVYLFAPKGSETKAVLCDFGIVPTGKLKDTLPANLYEKKVHEDEAMLFQKMVAFGTETHIDVYHLHQSLFMQPLIASAPKKCPFIITLHDPVTGKYEEALRHLSLFPNVWFVSITNAQRAGSPARFIDTVPHGTRMDIFPYASTSRGYVAVMGRIIPEKGQDDAIAAVQKTHDTLYLIGEKYVDNARNRTYWEHDIAPYIDNSVIKYLSVMPRSELHIYYQGAKALLMPIKWEEPFGLVMIEAMACGTPVIAYNRGSVPEIVRDGVTGFIIDPDPSAPIQSGSADGADRPGYGTWIIKKQGIDGLVEAIGRIGEIDRMACRRHVEDHFTIEKMVDGYERVYRKILSDSSH